MSTTLSYLRESASQTAGPYVHLGLMPREAGFDIFETNFANVLCSKATLGERIRIEGRVIDGAGAPVFDALVEIWQANAAGRYAHPGDTQDKPLDAAFRGWGRSSSDFETGMFAFETIKPGAVTGRDGKPMAPHVSLWVVARGVNVGLHTRMYFPEDSAAHLSDPVLNLVDSDARRKTLVATRKEGAGIPVYRFDIYLQGALETVFFDL